MKNRFLQLFAITTACTLFFACSTSKKYSSKSFGGSWGEPKVAKQTPGNSLQTSGSNSSSSSTHVESGSTQTTGVPATEPSNVNATYPVPAMATQAPESQKQSTATNAQKNVSKAATGKMSLVQKAKALRKMRKEMQKMSNLSPQVDKSNIVIFILLFILAFFIPPLTYYLATESTDTWFWVCLICFILGLSYLVSVALGGLAFLASIVIALIGLFS